MLRRKQKELRERDILLKSLEIFVTKGYYDTKITDIADYVGMSVGLLFHYFDSKEDLYFHLVELGVAISKKPEILDTSSALGYFREMLTQLFDYAKNEPWVFQMFILMNQARKKHMPARIRRLAAQVNQIDFSARVIARGQAEGTIRDGSPKLLSACFWASVQGVMEEMAASESQKMPDPEWLISILKKEEL